jgi:hypothetical protein
MPERPEGCFAHKGTVPFFLPLSTDQPPLLLGVEAGAELHRLLNCPQPSLY